MNTYRYATIATALLTSVSVHAQQAVQWKVSDGGNGHWYQLIRTGQNAQHWLWSTAAAAASARGAHLVTFSSDFESSAVYLRLGLATATNCVAWIGFMQIPGSAEPGGGWRWVTMEPTEFLNWKPGYPDDSGCSIAGEHQDFAVIGSGGDPRWDDSGDPTAECPYGVPFAVIEYDTDCNQDGIIDYGQCHDGTLADYNGNIIPDCCERGEVCVVGNYPAQWRVEDGGNGHWYQFEPTSLTHDEAKNRAQLVGAHLATCSDVAEWSNVVRCAMSRLQSELYFHIGLFQDRYAADYQEPAGGWRWEDGTSFQYSAWGAGEPNNTNGAEDLGHGFLVAGGGASWNDIGPASFGAVLEWSADCNQDGIVDYGQILQGQLADTNTDGIPDTCQCGTIPSLPGCCPGDLDHDRAVGGADIGLLLSNWGPCGSACPYDLNNDTKVNGGDLGLLLAGWGPCQ
jgi:hypothetical protein